MASSAGVPVAAAAPGEATAEPADADAQAAAAESASAVAVGEPPPASPAPEAAPGPEAGESALALPAAARGARKPTRYGLSIHFEEQPESAELGRLVEATVLVNTAHPAWTRAVASRSEGYHIALSVAMALAPLAADAAGTHAFVTRFLARWGEALMRDRRRRGAR